jgi:hypothetical protein
MTDGFPHVPQMTLEKWSTATHNTVMSPSNYLRQPLAARRSKPIARQAHAVNSFRRLSVLIAMVMPILAGCGEDEYKRPAAEDPLGRPENLAISPAGSADSGTVPIPAVTSGDLHSDLRSDLGLTTERFGLYSNRDLTEKADAFWKLYWMTKAVNEGHALPGMRTELDALDQAVRKMRADKNVSAITSILKLVRTGLAASDLEARLSRRGVRTASLGWSGGSYDMNRVLTRGQGSSSTRIHIGPKLTASDARLAAAWATLHHKSPLMVERESYQRAAQMTADLGDTLDDERRQAGEHLIGRDKVLPGAGIGNPYESMFPAKIVR